MTSIVAAQRGSLHCALQTPAELPKSRISGQTSAGANRQQRSFGGDSGGSLAPLRGVCAVERRLEFDVRFPRKPECTGTRAEVLLGKGSCSIDYGRRKIRTKPFKQTVFADVASAHPQTAQVVLARRRYEVGRAPSVAESPATQRSSRRVSGCGV